MDVKVTNVATDLKDGTYLIQLLELVSGKSVGKYTKAPKIAAAQLENLANAFKFIAAQGMKWDYSRATWAEVAQDCQHWPQRHPRRQSETGARPAVDGTCAARRDAPSPQQIIYNYQVAKSFENAPQAHGKKGGVKDQLLEVRATCRCGSHTCFSGCAARFPSTTSRTSTRTGWMGGRLRR